MSARSAGRCGSAFSCCCSQLQPGLTIDMYIVSPKGFLPQQDTGLISAGWNHRPMFPSAKGGSTGTRGQNHSGGSRCRGCHFRRRHRPTECDGNTARLTIVLKPRTGAMLQHMLSLNVCETASSVRPGSIFIWNPCRTSRSRRAQVDRNINTPCPVPIVRRLLLMRSA